MRRRARAQRAPTRTIAGARVGVLLFSKGAWTLDEARLWAKAHHFRHEDYDAVENYYRIFQSKARGKPENARTIPFGPNVRAVMEWRR